MIPIVLVVETLDGNDAATLARRRRVDALRDRADDLVLVSANPDESDELLMSAGLDAELDARLAAGLEAGSGAGVVVVDGDLALLARVADAARASGHRILWSVDAEPSAAGAARAGELADGALVADSAWFPRRVGMRAWVVHDRSRARASASADGTSDATAQPWPPAPGAWADRVVQAAQSFSPAAPTRAAPAPAAALASGLATGEVAAASATQPASSPADFVPLPPVKRDQHEDRRGRRGVVVLFGILAVAAGLAIAAAAGVTSPGTSDRGRPDGSAGVDSTPSGSNDSGDRAAGDGGNDGGGGNDGSGSNDTRGGTTGSGTGRRTGGGSSGSSGSGSGGGGTGSTSGGAGGSGTPTTPTTKPPTTTVPPPPPTTVPPPPPTTSPPPPTTAPPPPTTVPPPPPTTSPPPPTTSPAPPTTAKSSPAPPTAPPQRRDDA